MAAVDTLLLGTQIHSGSIHGGRQALLLWKVHAGLQEATIRLSMVFQEMVATHHWASSMVLMAETCRQTKRPSYGPLVLTKKLLLQSTQIMVAAILTDCVRSRKRTMRSPKNVSSKVTCDLSERRSGFNGEIMHRIVQQSRLCASVRAHIQLDHSGRAFLSQHVGEPSVVMLLVAALFQEESKLGRNATERSLHLLYLDCLDTAQHNAFSQILRFQRLVSFQDHVLVQTKSWRK